MASFSSFLRWAALAAILSSPLVFGQTLKRSFVAPGENPAYFYLAQGNPNTGGFTLFGVQSEGEINSFPVVAEIDGNLEPIRAWKSTAPGALFSEGTGYSFFAQDGDTLYSDFAFFTDLGVQTYGVRARHPSLNPDNQEFFSAGSTSTDGFFHVTHRKTGMEAAWEIRVTRYRADGEVLWSKGILDTAAAPVNDNSDPDVFLDPAEGIVYVRWSSETAEHRFDHELVLLTNNGLPLRLLNLQRPLVGTEDIADELVLGSTRFLLAKQSGQMVLMRLDGAQLSSTDFLGITEGNFAGQTDFGHLRVYGSIGLEGGATVPFYGEWDLSRRTWIVARVLPLTEGVSGALYRLQLGAAGRYYFQVRTFENLFGQLIPTGTLEGFTDDSFVTATLRGTPDGSTGAFNIGGVEIGQGFPVFATEQSEFYNGLAIVLPGADLSIDPNCPFFTEAGGQWNVIEPVVTSASGYAVSVTDHSTIDANPDPTITFESLTVALEPLTIEDGDACTGGGGGEGPAVPTVNVRIDDGLVFLEFISRSGFIYQPQRRPWLNENDWIDIDDIRFGNNEPIQIVVPLEGLGDQHSFRLKIIEGFPVGLRSLSAAPQR